MRIPGNELHHRHIASYGAGAMELEVGVAEPGCPRLYKKKYEGKPEPETPAWQLQYGTAFHEAMYLVEEHGMDYAEALKQAWPVGLSEERFAEALQDFSDLMDRGGVMTQLHTVAVEQHLTAPLYEDEDFGPITFGGILDVVSVGSDLEEDPSLWLVDYKTDRSPPSYVKVSQWRQGTGYAFLLRANSELYLPHEPHPKIRGVYEAVKHYSLPLEYSDEQMDVWAAWAESIARTILRDEKGKPKLQAGCSWCEIRSSCSPWKRMPSKGLTLAERMDGTDLEERVKWLMEAKATRGRLDSAVKSVEGALRARLEVKAPFVVSGTEWYLDAAEARKADVMKLHEIMGDEFYNVAKVTLGDVDKWAKKNLDRRSEIERAVKKVPAGKRLKSREAE